MRNKEEQLKRSFGIIEEQAKELVETYGWDIEHVNELKSSLLKHAIQEIEYWHEIEDCSGSWNLASWKSYLRVSTSCNFKELEDVSDMSDVYELRGFVYELVDKFHYIENIELRKLECVAEYSDKKCRFGVKLVNGKYLIWSIDNLIEYKERLGFFETAKLIYREVLEKNNEIENISI